MSELTPHIVLSVLGNADMQRAQNVLAGTQKRLHAMGIEPLFVPENFSSEEALQWICDVTSPEDFFLHITFDEEQKVFFRDGEEEQTADLLSKELSFRFDAEYGRPAPLFTVGTQNATFLSSLPLHTWDIHIDGKGVPNSQLEMAIMASVTDLYFLEHPLLPEENRWPFRDVPSNHFASSAIKKAKQQHIIPGYKGDILKPNSGITRSEVLHILEKLGHL